MYAVRLLEDLGFWESRIKVFGCIPKTLFFSSRCFGYKVWRLQKEKYRVPYQCVEKWQIIREQNRWFLIYFTGFWGWTSKVLFLDKQTQNLVLESVNPLKWWCPVSVLLSLYPKAFFHITWLPNISSEYYYLFVSLLGYFWSFGSFSDERRTREWVMHWGCLFKLHSELLNSLVSILGIISPPSCFWVNIQHWWIFYIKERKRCYFIFCISIFFPKIKGKENIPP